MDEIITEIEDVAMGLDILSAAIGADGYPAASSRLVKCSARLKNIVERLSELNPKQE